MPARTTRHEPRYPRREILAAMPSVSAQYSIVLRVEIDHRPGMLGPGRHRHRRGRREHRLRRPGRDRGRAHAARHHDRDRGRGARARRSARRSTRSTAPALIDITDRTFQMHVGGKIEQRNKLADPHPRRPQHGLHARRRPRVHGDRPRPRQGLPVHDQAQHGGRRLRRQRGARPRRHRPRGGDARDGGQGRAVQGVRRRRRVPDLPGHQGPRRDRRRRCIHIAPTFGGINLEDISRPALLRDRGPAQAAARHPGLPRRPARHRGRRARRADQRRQADRQAGSRTSRC